MPSPTQCGGGGVRRMSAAIQAILAKGLEAKGVHLNFQQLPARSLTQYAGADVKASQVFASERSRIRANAMAATCCSSTSRGGMALRLRISPDSMNPRDCERCSLIYMPVAHQFRLDQEDCAIGIVPAPVQ